MDRRAISYFGDMMNTTALAIMLYLITKSPSVVAPRPDRKSCADDPVWAGGRVFGDRVDRQRLMIGADLIRAVLTVIIPFLLCDGYRVYSLPCS